MSRFEDIQKGRKARKAVELPNLLDHHEGGLSTVLVDLIVLEGTAEAAALAAAVEYAKRYGVTDPKEGNPHYDLGLMVHTLARACVDHDVPGSFSFFFCPSDAPESFERAAEAILQNFDVERIQFLYQQQKIWQEECSPWGKGDTEQQIIEKLIRLRGVADPALPFKQWRLATVGSLLLTTVNRLAVLLEDKSGPGSFSWESSKPSASEPAKNGASEAS